MKVSGTLSSQVFSPSGGARASKRLSKADTFLFSDLASAAQVSGALVMLGAAVVAVCVF